jgi:multidrug resistance protein, MATE family
MNRRTSFRSSAGGIHVGGGTSEDENEEIEETNHHHQHHTIIDKPATLAEEMQLIVNLAIPSIVAQMGWSVPSALVASYVGIHFGSVYLDAYMLVMVVVSVGVFALLEGIFGALDTLLPQAYGAGKYRDMELISVRCVITCIVIIVPFLIILSTWLEEILIALGQDPEVSHYAEKWFRVYGCSLPFYALFHTMSNFLTSQNIMMPEVVSVLFSALFVLPILLYTFGSTLGFLGTSVAVALYQIFQTLSLTGYLAYAKPYHPETWTGDILTRSSSWAKALKWKPFSNFLMLGAGGILAR